MGSPEQVARAVSGWGRDKAHARERCLVLLEAIVQAMEEAEDVWSQALDESPASTDRFTPVLWIGSDRARHLHRIHAKVRGIGGELTTLTGVALKDTLGIVDAIDIVDAYGQLRPDESGADRARSALETLASRKAGVADAIAVVRAAAEATA